VKESSNVTATERQREQLIAQISPVISAVGYELEDVSVNRVGRRSLVRITVDSDAGVDLDAIADVSRVVSDCLDADDPFNTPFVLEVTSPGIDRPLIEPRHWRRNVARMVIVDVAGKSTTGRILAVHADGIELDVVGHGSPVITVGWAGLGPGRVQVEFSRPKGAPEPEPVEEIDDEIEERG
jgi:ribosome maturation factor RimP